MLAAEDTRLAGRLDWGRRHSSFDVGTLASGLSKPTSKVGLLLCMQTSEDVQQGKNVLLLVLTALSNAKPLEGAQNKLQVETGPRGVTCLVALCQVPACFLQDTNTKWEQLGAA